MQRFIYKYDILLLEIIFFLYNFGTANRLRHPCVVSLRSTTCNIVVLWFQVDIAGSEIFI
jgi:hypothetical protein